METFNFALHTEQIKWEFKAMSKKKIMFVRSFSVHNKRVMTMSFAEISNTLAKRYVLYVLLFNL